MRIIDADRLLTERMKSKYYHLPNGDIAIPIIDIEHAPTIDAVSVVICKDCKHWNKAPNTERGWCDKCDGLLEPNFYCADGEREGE